MLWAVIIMSFVGMSGKMPWEMNDCRVVVLTR